MLRESLRENRCSRVRQFQRAPTLGGECYWKRDAITHTTPTFQQAPTLGGECYVRVAGHLPFWASRFNKHPPLGVNATIRRSVLERHGFTLFQRAPTLGGECYGCARMPRTRRPVSFNGHPPLGVNATALGDWCSEVTRASIGFNGHPPLGVNATPNHDTRLGASSRVSTGTHPWG